MNIRLTDFLMLSLQVKVGDYVVIANHLTRVVPDNCLANTYPDYKPLDYADVERKIAETNAPKTTKSVKAADKTNV